jgi:hypothetical protein
VITTVKTEKDGREVSRSRATSVRVPGTDLIISMVYEEISGALELTFGRTGHHPAVGPIVGDRTLVDSVISAIKGCLATCLGERQ